MLFARAPQSLQILLQTLCRVSCVYISTSRKQLATSLPVRNPPSELSKREQNDRDFAPFRAIPNELFKTQLLKHIDPTQHFTNPRVRIQRRVERTSHHVVMLQFGAAKFGIEYVFKIPVTGTKERWNEEHAYAMDCEAMLMRYIKEKTHIPVPEIKAVELDAKNELGVPYILMKKLPGKTAYRV
ncbi:hypothetical protein BDW02DRAFT_606901 [Decorospora gaudefroyi]|uniref:Aminoglycoside phosphotransferase domain-containing protein n=1 Tax=Decorospora gaudefroyi TaxID=184978 RepID=A0A6A5K9E9_9PLEO|nr:hypothetical protein BDW02DRAFT_606901 [Decorospora gaudefroyi]